MLVLLHKDDVPNKCCTSGLSSPMHDGVPLTTWGSAGHARSGQAATGLGLKRILREGESGGGSNSGGGGGGKKGPTRSGGGEIEVDDNGVSPSLSPPAAGKATPSPDDRE